MSDEERKLNRRVFLKYAAFASAAAGTWAGIEARTDALAQQVVPFGVGRDPGTAGSPYAYHDE